MELTISITKCPSCQAKYSFTDMLSGNTIDGEFWSDGYFIAPNMLDVVKFAKCPTCGAFFWLPENLVYEQSDSEQVNELENSLDSMDRPLVMKYLKEAMNSGIFNTPEKEIYIRVKLWQVINHTIRKYVSQSVFEKIKLKFFKTPDFEDSKKMYDSLAHIKRTNLIRIINLMKMDKSEIGNYLLFAEVYRETGDFNKAMIFCYKAETSNQIDASRAALLKQHIQNKNKMVYKL